MIYRTPKKKKSWKCQNSTGELYYPVNENKNHTKPSFVIKGLCHYGITSSLMILGNSACFLLLTTVSGSLQQMVPVFSPLHRVTKCLPLPSRDKVCFPFHWEWLGLTLTNRVGQWWQRAIFRSVWKNSSTSHLLSWASVRMSYEQSRARHHYQYSDGQTTFNSWSVTDQPPREKCLPKSYSGLKTHPAVYDLNYYPMLVNSRKC